MREAHRLDSKQKRELIAGKFEEAYHLAKDSRGLEDLSKAESILDQGLSGLKEAVLLRENGEVCWEKWREVKETIYRRRKKIRDSNYQQLRSEAESALNIANDGNPHQALARVKEIQRNLNGVQISKPQRQEIEKLLNQVWEKAISRINEIREEKRRKQEEWLSRMKDHLDRWKNSIQKNEKIISELKDEIDKLTIEKRKARSYEHAGRLRRWIEEKQQKIRDIRETNNKLKEKINSVKSKIEQAEISV